MSASSVPSYKAEEFLTSWNATDVKGHGSFACVRKCQHSQLGKVVAKCFKITGSSKTEEDAIKEIEREMVVLYRLDHKNVVKLYGTTRWANNVAIIMECVEGGSLEELLHSKKNIPDIPWLLRIRLYYELADALSYLHHYDQRKAFVHGDLKPQNILLTPNLVIKIADFGSVNIAIQSRAMSASIKILGSCQHTVYFSPPEVLKNPLMERKPSIDVYGVGMIGYEIVTRHEVYQRAANPNIVIQAIIDRGQKPDAKFLDEAKSSLEDKPQDLQIFNFLENIITKCWDFKVENRPDIRDVRNQLSKEMKALGSSTHSYHINHLKVQSKTDNSSRIGVKIKLSEFNNSFEEGPMPTPPFEPEISPSNHPPILEGKHTNQTVSDLSEWLRSSSPRLLQQQYGGKSTDILLVGGFYCPQSVVQYNIISKEFTEIPDTNISRKYSSALIYGGFVYLMGGWDGGGRTTLDSVEILNLHESTLKWEIHQTSMIEGRDSFASTVLNGKIYCVGGWNGRRGLSSVNYYDPEIGKWFESKKMDQPRRHHAMVAARGKLYVFGGFVHDGYKVTNSAVCFDPNIGKWRNISSMKECRVGACAVLLRNEIFVMGGIDERSNDLSSVEKYNLDSMEWKKVKSMKEKRCAAAACLVDHRIYVFGGVDAKSVEVYDSHKNSWNTETSMDRERYYPSVVSI